MWVCICLCACMCPHMHAVALRGQKTVSDPLEEELQPPDVVAEN